ncbi:MAG: dTDP-4-dehydrorhamnose reductase [Phototrophicales bacterium]|nr:MAG: dTDP-4-dehydrorhamnose reductase [Phototrophicales bacterium]
MKILITGASGQLGRVLLEQLSNDDTYEVFGCDRDTYDITNVDSMMTLITQQFQPQLVIHCAALTKVDYCAENPDEALRINGYGTRNIALACQKIDAAMLYVSSNEVFDGTNPDVYLEYDKTHAINPYGYSKLVGEQIVRDLVRRHYIVRTSWLFGHGGRNFIHAILNRAKDGHPLRVVINEVATPTYVNDLATAIIQLIATELYGVYHLVNEGRASRWNFARYVLDITGFRETPIERITSYEYQRASTPPEYSVLRNFAAAQAGIVLRHWQEAVKAFCKIEGLLKEE